MTRHLLAFLALSLTACPEDDKRPIGGTCNGDEQCAAGTCIANVCLDPNGDEDSDGLINQVEGALGTDPFSKDTDGDGIEDGDEVGGSLNAIDTDGDGKADALESNSADADSDCLADQVDPDDALPETDPAVLGAELCIKVGACGAEGAVLTATCPTDLVAVCDYAQVPLYEADEAACDGVDNDCDGQTDERQAAGGSVTFDGGPYAADAGKVLGETCGAGACAGGSVVCAVDKASLVCSTSDRVGALTCSADNNCNGADDLTEVADPLTTPLLGCVDHYVDGDSDTFGAIGQGMCLCDPTGTYEVTVTGDCRDDHENIFPNAEPICGTDSDCDESLVDEGEGCDDGNTDTSDGCDACEVKGTTLSRNDSAGNTVLVNLGNGGFVIAWSEGYANESWLGNSIAFFGADGVEKNRLSGLGLDTEVPSEGFVLEASGDVVVYLAWMFVGQGYQLEARRFDADGNELGEPVALTSPMEPAWQLGVVPTSNGAFKVWWVMSWQMVMVDLDATGMVGTAGGYDNYGALDWYDFEMVGFDDGSVIALWQQYEINPETESYIYRTMRARFVDNQVVDIPVEVDTGSSIELKLARWSGGWALLTMSEVFEGEENGVSVTAQLYTGETRVGPVRTIIDFDTSGCPYDFAGGINENDQLFALLMDGECRSALRGTMLVDGVPTELPLGVANFPETSFVEDASTTRRGTLTLAYEVRDYEFNFDALIAYRFRADLTPQWIRLMPRTF